MVNLSKANRPARRRVSGAQRGQSLPDDACPACGTAMVEKRRELRLPVNGEAIAVASALHLNCPSCREVVLRFQDQRDLAARAMATYRRKHGLLSAEDLRGIRERFDLAQGGFAHLLGLDTNQISRWESGRSVQTETMDLLLRMVRDLPGSIEYPRRHGARPRSPQ